MSSWPVRGGLSGRFRWSKRSRNRAPPRVRVAGKRDREGRGAAKGEDVMEGNRERDRAVELAIGQIEKQFGKGAIMKMGADAVTPDVATVSTGSLSLDIALGVGGLPRGRVIEIYGPESSGKTTLALHTIAEAQKKGGICASSTSSTRSTRSMRASSASMSTSC